MKSSSLSCPKTWVRIPQNGHVCKVPFVGVRCWYEGSGVGTRVRCVGSGAGTGGQVLVRGYGVYFGAFLVLARLQVHL